SPTLWPVQIGDYLQVKKGPVHRIRDILSAEYNDLRHPPPPLPPPDNWNRDLRGRRRIPQVGFFEANLLVLESPFEGVIPRTFDWRIVRAPRALNGETPLQLPQNVA